MISIIICSRQSDISLELKDNISTTIGCEYELVVIDNSANKYNIFQAYNEGVNRAKGEILCFIHDDVLFRTEGWGLVLIEILSDSIVGIIGVEGCHFLPDTPLYWSNSPFVSDYVIDNDHGILQDFFKCDYFDEDGMSEVVVCDGVFFCMRTEIANMVRFDEEYYNGFHMYDMDICMQVREKGFCIYVTNKILLEHAWSEGDMKTKKGMNLFEINLEKFCKKWNNILPMWKGIDNIPKYSKIRINNLCRQAYDAKLARRSKSYRLGRLLLVPFKWIKGCLNENPSKI